MIGNDPLEVGGTDRYEVDLTRTDSLTYIPVEVPKK